MADIMTPTGPPDRHALLHAQESIDDTYRYLAEMADSFIADVKVEWDKLRHGSGDIKKVNKLLTGELISLLRIAKATEGSLNGLRNDRAGQAGAYAIDFGQARLEVRSRLDRIAAFREAGGVS